MKPATPPPTPKGRHRKPAAEPRADKATRYFIGIDPGAATGWAVWDADLECFAEMETLTFWTAYERAADRANPWPPGTVFVIEDPRQNVTYDRDGQGVRQMQKISRNVGKNQAQAKLLAEGLERLGFEVRYVVPQSAKLGHDTFARWTGLRKRVSQHCRDAARLVFQMTS